ncbi:unnamed protein product [Rhizophagus irregularis]|nr:unnamed protein product [Rhizophagus irregularis]
MKEWCALQGLRPGGHTQGEMITLYMVSMKEWCALQGLRPGGQGEVINGNSSTTRTWRFSLNNPKNHKVIRKPRKNIKEATIYGHTQEEMTTTLYMVSIMGWCALQGLRPGGIRPVASKVTA